MNAFLRLHRLVSRGDAGLACDEGGVALGGAELARVRHDADGVARCEVRSANVLGQILREAYGPQPDAQVGRIHRGLLRTAAWIEAGDLASAGIEAVMLRLPDLHPDAMAKLADFERVANTAWETEPRVPAGQSTGGQWTTGGGAPPESPATNPIAHEPPQDGPVRATSSASLENTGESTSTRSDNNAFDPNFLVPVSTAATVAGAGGASDTFALPESVARLGRAGLLALAAGLLDQWGAASAQDQISKAEARFGLDPSRPADVLAASAYVWSRYALPLLTDAPFSGPKLDAASQAVMRFVLANPGAFTAMLQGSSSQRAKSFSLVIDAANRGLADYAWESRARPPGVAPELQTTSRSARRAIADQLKDRNFEAHHLVPAYNWGKSMDITELAHADGWEVDGPSNLIGLPATAKAQAEAPEWLPIHSYAGHAKYNDATYKLILAIRSEYPPTLTPVQAHAILDEAARINRERIKSGYYGPILKSGA